MRSVENCQVYWQLAPGVHLGVGGALGDEEEESESAEPDDPSMTCAIQTLTHENTGGREHNTELEIPSNPAEVCPTVRGVENCQVCW